MHWIQPSQVQLFWVPCTFESKTDTFHPIYTLATYPFATKNSTTPIARRQTGSGWTEEEDEQLASLVGEIGLKQWSQIALTLNQQFHSGDSLRNGKQCRERWHNHLDPDLNSNC